MSIIKTNFEAARCDARTIAAKEEFARKVEQACDVLASMETQQQAFKEVIASSLKTLGASRVLLLEVEQLQAVCDGPLDARRLQKLG